MFEEFWHEYTHLVTDPAHLALEITMIIMVDVILLGIAWPFIKKMIRKHDESVHGKDQECLHSQETNQCLITSSIES